MRSTELTWRGVGMEARKLKFGVRNYPAGLQRLGLYFLRFCLTLFQEQGYALCIHTL